MKKDDFLDVYTLHNKFINIYKEILSQRQVRAALEKYIIQMKDNSTNLTYLDIGCGSGERTLLFQNHLDQYNFKTYGIDVNIHNVKEAKRHGIETMQLNIENRPPPFKAHIITCFEIIEHIFDTDTFITHVAETLEKDGILLISTPNTVSWKNRIAMMVGVPPLNLEGSLHGYDGLKICEHAYQDHSPAGHIRGFTPLSLKEMLEDYGFSVDSIWGLENWKMKILLNRFPSLATNFMIIAKQG
jgi:SAM-dependent methyltransferase